MTDQNKQALWGINATVAVLKLSGEWRFEKSLVLERFVQQILPTIDTANIVVDLNEVTLLDSTILGLLAQIGLTIRKQLHQTVTLVSMNLEINEVLLSMAFDTIFKFVVHAPQPYPDLLPLTAASVDEKTLEETVLHSHKTLTSLSEHNKKAFADLIKMLEG